MSAAAPRPLRTRSLRSRRIRMRRNAGDTLRYAVIVGVVDTPD